MPLEILILGSGSGAPLPHRHTSAQLLKIAERFVLLDCGEATQIRLREHQISFSRIDTICITHFHGDHVFGLPGLLHTFNLLGRVQPLHLIALKEVHEFVDFIFQKAGYRPNFELNKIEIPEGKNGILEFEKYTITFFPLKHRIATSGYLIREKEKPPKIKKEFIMEYQPSIDQIKEIKAGKDFITSTGQIIPNASIIIPSPEPLSYAYVTDTIYDESIIPFIKGSTCLYHEATYLSDMVNGAYEKKHSTAAEAAKIASLAGVKKLILGHFSSRYKDLTLFLEEAKQYFEEVILAEDGMKIQLK
jgi:ribonuclease Z